MTQTLSNAHQTVRRLLDTQIHELPGIETLRWKWLGVLVIIGATIPPRGFSSYEVEATFLAFLGAFISVCWDRSTVTRKAAIALGCGFTVFVHRYLQLPGISYGFYSLLMQGEFSSAPWNLNGWFLLLLAFDLHIPLLAVVGVHYYFKFLKPFSAAIDKAIQIVWHGLIGART